MKSLVSTAGRCAGVLTAVDIFAAMPRSRLHAHDSHSIPGGSILAFLPRDEAISVAALADGRGSSTSWCSRGCTTLPPEAAFAAFLRNFEVQQHKISPTLSSYLKMTNLSESVNVKGDQKFRINLSPWFENIYLALLFATTRQLQSRTFSASIWDNWIEKVVFRGHCGTEAFERKTIDSRVVSEAQTILTAQNEIVSLLKAAHCQSAACAMPALFPRCSLPDTAATQAALRYVMSSMVLLGDGSEDDTPVVIPIIDLLTNVVLPPDSTEEPNVALLDCSALTLRDILRLQERTTLREYEDGTFEKQFQRILLCDSDRKTAVKSVSPNMRRRRRRTVVDALLSSLPPQPGISYTHADAAAATKQAFNKGTIRIRGQKASQETSKAEPRRSFRRNRGHRAAVFALPRGGRQALRHAHPEKRYVVAVAAGLIPPGSCLWLSSGYWLDAEGRVCPTSGVNNAETLLRSGLI